jgi:hypothetical protein
MDRGLGAEQHQVVVDYHSALVNQAGRPRRLPGQQLPQIAAIALQCLGQETGRAVALHYGLSIRMLTVDDVDDDPGRLYVLKYVANS